KYKGVVPQQNGNWGAQIYTNNQRIWIGTFRTELDAAIAYDPVSIKLRSSDASRNFPWSETTVQEAKLVIPKKHAVMYFPPVPDPDTDKSQGFANDEVFPGDLT
ncbi:AP2/ERF and B3 domain-containing transcription factor like protein, partial [Tanacetum coccineum]